MKERQARPTSGDKSICLPMPPDQDYTTFVEDTTAYRVYLDAMIEAHPELFPSDIDKGYGFHGFVESGKLRFTNPENFAQEQKASLSNPS